MPTHDNGMIHFQDDAIGADSISLFKINNAGQIVWAKRIRKYKVAVWENMQELSNNDILLNGRDSSTLFCTNGCTQNIHLLLDENGNILYETLYDNQSNDYGWITCDSGPGQSLVFAGTRASSNGGGFTILRNDTLMVPDLITIEAWSHNYSFTNATSYYLSVDNLYVINNFVYIGGTYANSQNQNNDAGIWMLKLDYTTGDIISQMAYRITGQTVPSDSTTLQSSAGFKPFGNKFVFTFRLLHTTLQNNEIGYIQIDDDLNIIHPPIAVSSSTVDPTNAYPIINGRGKSLYIIPGWHAQAHYAFIDSMNNLSDQFHISNVPNATNLFQFYFKNNNLVNLSMSVGLGGSLYLQSMDIPLSFLMDSGCITLSQSDFAISRKLPYKNSNFNWDDVLPHDIATIGLLQNQPENSFILQSLLACQQESLCNTIKLLGDNNLCFSDSPVVFTASKNNKCLKKIDWEADTSYASPFKFLNDSSVSVQFKKAGSFFMHATLTGCGIADSLLITIRPRLRNVSIGSDTLLCPGAADTLRPSPPYQKYLWQDGSTSPFFIANSPGTYHLTATDICNNTSSASVKVSYDTSLLSAGKSFLLCKSQDTALSATAGFSGYQWLPTGAILGSAMSQTIQIAPSATTDYIVRATSPNGCLLSDTLKVTVEDCLDKLVMPTAFTPNNDGINDVVKPKVFGPLEKYELYIYNRWGQLVFHSSSPGEGWDGKLNGAAQSSGMFVWACRYRFAGENEKTGRGSFLLIR
ncbi:MAG: gliding motility-associated C-terminal domain-containing protein [Bacteroidetes bacterium]|nr:gliding motility-associated C-terminal domain-containing protein [Bacteroidota bacterium]